MIKTEKLYNDYLDKVQSEILKINLSDKNLKLLKKELKEVNLIIPVVGTFSAGKSSLINSFLNNNVLPVGITPETALASELRYSSNERIEAVKKNESFDAYGITDMEKVKANAKEYKHLRIYLKNEGIRNIEPLILVDMPGYDSPLDLHNQAIIRYLDKGVHYVVLINSEDGTMNDSVRRHLQDIEEFNGNFSFFLSKSDCKPQSDLMAIKEVVEEQISDYLDIEKSAIPINNTDGEALRKVLKEIDPDHLFKSMFVERLKDNYYDITDEINLSISTLKKSKEETDQILKELKSGEDKILRKKESMIADIREKYSNSAVNSVVESVGRDLSSSSDEIVSAFSSGGKDGFSRCISEIVRHSLISNVKDLMIETSGDIINDFSHELSDINKSMFDFVLDENITNRLADNVKGFFDGSNKFLKGAIDKQKGSESLYKVLTTIFSITTSILNPVVEMLIVFLPNIFSGLFGNFQKNKQDEQIKSKIMTSVIPSIKRDLQSKLPDIFDKQVNLLINNISEDFESKLKEQQETIKKAETEKQAEIQNIEAKIADYEQTVLEITNLTKEYDIFTTEI